MSKVLAIILVLLTVLSKECDSAKESSNQVFIDSLANTKFQGKSIIIPNGANTYSLIHSSDTSGNKGSFNYFVVKHDNKKVILEGKYNPGGYVKWAGDSRVEVLSIPKHVQTVPDTSMYKRVILLEERK
jgi:hypothetical protein